MRREKRAAPAAIFLSPTLRRRKTAVDGLMTISLLLLMAYELISQTTHEVIGTVMFLLLILHHALNRIWS